MTTITPTRSYNLFEGKVSVHALGRYDGDGSLQNWTLAKLLDYHHGWNGYHLPVHDALRELGTNSILAPVPSNCNAVILPQGYLDQRIQPTIDLGNKKKVYRGGKYGNTWAYADGVVLTSGQSFVVSSADCPTIVVMYEDKQGNTRVIACHAGRNSLIDYGMFKGQEPRQHFSVVDAIASIVGDKKNTAQVWTGLGLAPGPHFKHPSDSQEHPHNRAVNNRLCELFGSQRNACFLDDTDLGQYNLLQIIRTQLILAGFNKEHIELTQDVDTYGDTTPEGRHLFHSQCRDGNESGRNLVVVNFNR